jgi:hypothetical protein
MRRLGVWGLAAIGLVALHAALALAEEDEDVVSIPAKSSSWNPLGQLFNSTNKKSTSSENKEKIQKRAPGKGEGKGTGGRGFGLADAAVAARNAEMDKLFRRQEVCLKLRQIAKDLNDPELDRLAAQLDQRAWDVYRERTSNLPGASASLEEEERLEKRLPVTSGKPDSLITPAKKALSSREPRSTAAVREVKP